MGFEAKPVYSLTVVASDGVTTPTTKAVTLSVGNVDEVAPTITSGSTASVVENTGAGEQAYQAQAHDSADWSAGVSFSLSGADASYFTIDGATGEVTLTGNPDFETYALSLHDALPIYGVTTPTTKAVTLSVGNVDEVAPTITSGSTASVVENT